MKILLPFLATGLLACASLVCAAPAASNTISCPATAIGNCQSTGGSDFKCAGEYQNGTQKMPYNISGNNLNLLSSLQAGQFATMSGMEVCLYFDPLYPTLPAVGIISQ